MTTKKELLAKIADLQAQADSMPDEFRIETARAYETLMRRKKYWVVCPNTTVLDSVWANDNIDRARLEAGQIFLTKEATIREINRRKLWYECRKAMKDAWEAFGEIPDWSNSEQNKFVVHLYHNHVAVQISNFAYFPAHFPTRESREAWRSTVTDDDIKLMLIEEW